MRSGIHKTSQNAIPSKVDRKSFLLVSNSSILACYRRNSIKKDVNYPSAIDSVLKVRPPGMVCGTSAGKKF